MGEVSTIGLDIAKSVFQMHGVDSHGAVVIRKRVSRVKIWSCLRLCRRVSLGLKHARQCASLGPSS